ncbi:hypothetical protein [Homoserinimonas hongtaonis]|uniref:DUF5709 domain-containing protein n=1 Tax=Homoserinimonas hongtaonis TaxID=2079791 RepID=A0A2U1SYD2_9MICO|nr:hypothetical protein [Salinibacterium hongtaonis]PWB96616.1 hypothetical protein DF220_01265 [Salinibacterium hongtaonis]
MNNRDDVNSGGKARSDAAADSPDDALPFEQGLDDPAGAGTVETPNVDGGRANGAAGERPSDDDGYPADPLVAAEEKMQTVTNDAVAGEPVEGTVEDEVGPGIIQPIEGHLDEDEYGVDFAAVDGEPDTVAESAEADADDT